MRISKLYLLIALVTSGHAFAADLALTPWAPSLKAEAVAFLPNATERVAASTRDGLQLLDSKGAELARFNGNFSSLDTRAAGTQVLVASLDNDRQQALLISLDSASKNWGKPLYLPTRDYPVNGLCLYRDAAANLFVFLVGEEGKGFRYILSGMNSERILIAAECIGDAKWFLKKGSDYAKERVVFGAPIGRNQGVQFPLARAHAHMMAAEAIVYRAAALYDAGHNPGVEANTAKMLAADASWEAAEACLQTHGGFGFAEEYDVERKFREARLYQVAPISTNLILCYIAEQVLGLPKRYGEGRG